MERMRTGHRWRSRESQESQRHIWRAVNRTCTSMTSKLFCSNLSASAFFPSICSSQRVFSLSSTIFVLHDSPSLTFPIPDTNPLSPNFLVTPFSNQRDCWCAVVWALRSSFRGEEAFHAAECAVDIQRCSILSTQHQDCLPDRHAAGGQRARCPHLLFRPLSTLSSRREPIPPQSLADKLNMIRRHRVGPVSRGRRSHLRSGLCTNFDSYGNKESNC